MKNILGILSASLVFTLSSCISTAQFNNAEDDVYYSPRANNRKQPVMVPEVNVDEIIKKNPPQYGQPTNRVDDVTPNPNAAEGYRAYRAQQDSLYKKDPTLSGYYVNPNLPNSETDEITRRNNNRWFRRSFNGSRWNNWNYGLGWNSWYGPGFSVGYNNWGFDNFWGNNWGWNTGYPFNSWGCSPFYNNWNSGFGFYNPYFNNYWGNPWYGYGYGGYPHYYDNTNSGSGNTGNQPISRPRPSVGSSAPPVDILNQPNTSGGRNYQAYPQNSSNAVNPAIPANSGRSYTPTNGEQRLENVNGRIIYTRPQEVAPPVQTTNPDPNPGYRPAPDNNYNQPSQGSRSPSYNDSRGSYAPPVSAPSNYGGGRGSVPAGGGGRSSGGGGSVGGRRR